MLHAILIGFAAVVVVGCIVAATLYEISESAHHTQQEVRPRASKIDDEPRVYGDCTDCEAAVNATNGYVLKCRHPIHCTCAKFLHDTLKEVVCRMCGIALFNNEQAESNKGLRKREVNSPKCVACEKTIMDDPKSLKCSHKMHKACWARMEKTSTTCPRCMESAGEF